MSHGSGNDGPVMNANQEKRDAINARIAKISGWWPSLTMFGILFLIAAFLICGGNIKLVLTISTVVCAVGCLTTATVIVIRKRGLQRALSLIPK